VNELVPALQVEQARKRHVVDETGHRDGDDADQPERREQRGRAAWLYGEEQYRGPDDQVRVGREEREGVEGSLDRGWPAWLCAAVWTLMATPPVSQNAVTVNHTHGKMVVDFVSRVTRETAHSL
jgi:hypothetical protein